MFRIWDKTNNEYWDEEYIENTSIDRDGDVVFTEWILDEDESPLPSAVIHKYDATTSDRALIVEQFTGIYGKNKTKIYVGDIVFVEKYLRTTLNKQYLVTKSPKSSNLRMVPHDGEEHDYKECLGFDLANPKYLEVVGNINEGVKDGGSNL